MLVLKNSGRFVNVVSMAIELDFISANGMMTRGKYSHNWKGIELNMIGKSFHCFISFGGKETIQHRIYP